MWFSFCNFGLSKSFIFATLKETIPYHFDASLGSITRHISKALGKNFEAKAFTKGMVINAAQWTLISLLFNKGSLSQKEIAAMLFIDKVAVSRLVREMEKEGVIKKKLPFEDKRVRIVSLTPKGHTLYAQLSPIALETISEALGGLNASEITTLFEKLAHIKATLNRSL